MAEAVRDVKLLVTVRMYGAEPPEVIAQLTATPNDPDWYSTPRGEFEILSAELAPEEA